MEGNLRSGAASFEPRARLLKLLGAELIRDDVMAIVELVKNSHDADGSMVTLTFNATRDGSGEILVEDDGDGMSLEDFLTGWMQPAGSRKRKEEHHYTKSGRRVLGEKGVGRFAVDRLGSHVQLISRGKGEKTEIVAEFDWDEFNDGERALSDIASTWSERVPEYFRKGTGTLLRIGGLRSRWTERNFRKLSSRLKRLVSPFGNGHDFEIRITSDEFPDYSGSMEISFLDRAPYRITAKFDGKNTIFYQLGDKEPFPKPWEGPGNLECGPARITLHCFDLENDSLSRVGPRIDVRAWLREWSGVSIYRDGYRVLPYGEPDDDWLRLDQRRVNNPVVRLSTNQVCGFIEITGDGNMGLRDQTSRGGLLQNRSFEDLRALVLNVFRVVEAERQGIRHPKSIVNGKKNDLGELGLFVSRSLLDLVEVNRITDTQLKAELGPRFKAIEKGMKDAENRARKTLESYLDLAGIGQTTSFIVHDLKPRIMNLKGELKIMLEKASRADDLELGSTPGLIGNIIDEIEDVVDFISRSSGNKKGPRTRIDLVKEIQVFEASTSQLLANHDVSMSVVDRTQGVMRVFMRSESLAQVFQVLLWNSLDWFEGIENKKIRIRINREDSGACRLIFQDNGRGVEEDISDQIFEPGFTMKDGNRGMGLAVARELLRREGGDIILLRDRRRVGWTSFEIMLKAQRPKITSHVS